MTPKEKKVLVNDCINKITLTSGNIHVDYRFGIDEGSETL